MPAQVHFDCLYKGIDVASSRSARLLGGNRTVAEVCSPLSIFDTLEIVSSWSLSSGLPLCARISRLPVCVCAYMQQERQQGGKDVSCMYDITC